MKPLYEMTLEEARAADLAAIRAGAGAGEAVDGVREMVFSGPGGDLPVRVYRPAATRPLPTVVYFFGGGWTLGTIDTADAVARRLANAVPATVVVPGYRLAPEHPFPAAVEDCYAALQWASELGAPLAVAGDSAGGNLAAVTALLARDRCGPPVAGQILVYPNTDYTAADASMAEHTDPAIFNATSVAWYWGHYLRAPADGLSPLASPALAADHRGLPPALVLTAGRDPLRDQGERYAERLRSAGVEVELSRYAEMAHGFFTATGVHEAARDAQSRVAETLRGWLTGPFGDRAPSNMEGHPPLRSTAIE